MFKHLASWGFVVIGNDEPTSFSGVPSSNALMLLNKLNPDKNSVFYRKLNTHNAGISGHSQDGVGAINGTTNFTLTAFARRKNNDHSEILYTGDVYMTAFFRYTLMNDHEAKKVFAGNNPEMKQNPNWQDVEI